MSTPGIFLLMLISVEKRFKGIYKKELANYLFCIYLGMKFYVDTSKWRFTRKCSGKLAHSYTHY
ncbi:hypothetical protein METHB2_700005 [Candidatus Methylobacter favarea]|uniref:Uncharacterized protein n=1 Tax=Candidatus Methylobacter favarea TaxID=2707345 RepID=A0A8S0WLB5_9GAMM|nr:hypothetical protein METHB2_700005 [Candidatus Methylobacter favarea]